MLISRGNPSGKLSNTVGRPSGSAWVVIKPRGLWYRNSRVRSRGGNGLPSTVMTSLPVTSSAGELITRPLTVTRPCMIHSSASRREASPARDTTLAMRSPDFFSRRRPRRSRGPRVGLALAISATAAERRTLGENLAVILVVAARPVALRSNDPASLRGCSCHAFRRSLTRTIAFGTIIPATILARTRKMRTLFVAPLVA